MRKSKKILGIAGGTLAFLIVGVVIFVISAEFSGWHVLQWFGTSQAFFVYGAVALLAIFGGFFACLHLGKKK